MSSDMQEFRITNEPLDFYFLAFCWLCALRTRQNINVQNRDLRLLEQMYVETSI